MILPTPWQTAATYLVAATGHPIYAYLDHETAFHTEWKSLFPSRRILGGGAAASENLEPVAEEDFDDMDLENALDREVDREEDEQQVARALARGEKSAEIGKRLKEQKEKAEQDSPYLHPELRRELYRVHRNLGHPSLPRFLRALKHAGAKTEVLQWTKAAFRCPICAQNEKKSSYRPAHLQRSLAFNEVVGMDLIKAHDLWMLNMLCWGTNLQFVEVVDDKKAETIYQTFVKAWVAHYGPPTLIVVDQGNEFRDPFASKVNEMGINMHVIDVRSPWQNGRTEKAGGLFKERLEKVIQEATLVTDEEIRTAIYETAAAHNRYYHRSGFSPAQRVFGQNHRLPASLLSDDHLDRDLMVETASDSMKRAWQIREEAAKAWMKFQDDDAVRRALQARTRTADVKADLRPGALVYVWRDVPYYKGWSGPGTIIAETNQGKSLWISLRGYLVKASREQVRGATAEESLGAELSHVLSAELLQDIETGKIKNYRDVEGEGLPEDPYEPSIAPAEDAMEQELELHPHEREEVPPAEGELPGPVDMDVDPAESTAPPPTSEPTGGSRRPSEVVSEASRIPLRVDEGRGGVSSLYEPFRRSSTTSSSASVMPYPAPAEGVASWPRPEHSRNYYFEVLKHPDSQPACWRKDRKTGKVTLFSKETSKFSAEEAEGVYNGYDRCIYLTKAKMSPGQIEFRKLNDAHRKIFRAAREKELKSLLDSGAIRILSKEESREFMRNNPQHVLKSRFVDRWKPTDEFGVVPEQFGDDGFDPATHGGLAAKSRWCVVGWEDPHIHEIERTAPTPLTSSMYLFLQLSASRKWSARAKDAKTAFLQSRPTTRKKLLACRMPSDEAFPGYGEDQLILLLTEVYGLVSGPAWWRRSLLEILVKELGYRVNVYDRCVLTLDSQAEPGGDPSALKTEGIMVLEVDDILEAGGPRHRAKMDELEKKLRFGKVVVLQDTPQGTGYAGRRLKQLADYSFEYSMTDYVENRLAMVKLKEKVLKKDAAKVKLDEDGITQLRGAVASINWTAREGRPDASASASILSGVFPEPTVADAIACNEVVTMLKSRKVTLRIHYIAEKDIRHVLIADSSFDPSGRNKPQHGWLQGITDPKLNAGAAAPISLISWRSKRLRRKAGSTTLCESISLSTALAAMEKQVATMRSFQYSHFDPKKFMDDVEVTMGLRGPPTVIASENPRFEDPLTIAVIGAKSVFDSTSSPEQQYQGEDDRAALEAAIIHESLSRLQARLRWIPHNRNPADGLTKMPLQAHMQPLLELITKHEFTIQAEQDELAAGRQGDRRLKVHHWVRHLSDLRKDFSFQS